MAKKIKKHSVKLKSIMVECSKLAEKIPHSFGRMKLDALEADELSFIGWEGSIHANTTGGVSVEFKCLCGERHVLMLDE